MAKISITLASPGIVRVRLREFIGSAWNEYKKLCDETGFKSRRVNGEWHQLGPMSRVRELVDKMRDNGHKVNVAPDAVPQTAKERDVSHVKTHAMYALHREKLVAFPHQISGAEWLASREAGLLADSMGTGKSASALFAAPPHAPITIVCPSIVKLNWEHEVKKWRPDLNTTVLHGRNAWRWPNPDEVVIINYDVLPTPELHHRSVIAKPGCPEKHILILDEAHYAKNSQAKRSKSARSLSLASRAVNGGAAWLLTGTPLMNDPMELWGVLRSAALEQEAFTDWRTFLILFDGRPGTFGGWEFGKPTPEAPDRVKRVMLRRTREEVLPFLPEKRWRQIVVKTGLDAETMKLCDEAQAKLDEMGVKTDDVVSLVNQTKTQLPIFELITRARKALAIVKIPHLLALVDEYEEQKEPVVVFSSHRLPILTLGERKNWRSITGSTSEEDRQNFVREFQDGKLLGIALTTRAGGTGITLTRAAHSVFVDLDWTPAANVQAEDRLVRIGQNRGVLVTRIIASHSLDWRLLSLLSSKESLVNQVLTEDGKQQNRGTITIRDRVHSLLDRKSVT